MPDHDHAGEREPLLKKDKLATGTKVNNDGLPWSQVIILGLWRGTHALYFGYILTWITPFILSNGLGDSNTVGTIAGWIESAYSLGVLVGLAPASYLSDGIGRKPTAIIGVLLASIGTMSFGFASTLPQMIGLRFSIGVFVAFIPATVMTSLIELSNPKTLPTVFAISSVAWTTGSVIAPGLGGFLAEPALNYPWLFEGTIWEEYPYALSGVAAACIPILSTIIGYFILKETLPQERRQSIFNLFVSTYKSSSSACETSSSSSTADGSEGIQTKKSLPPTTWKGLLTRPVCYMLFCWGFFIFMVLTHLVAEVLFLSSPTSVGGLNLTPREMALLYSVRPLLSNVFNVMLYPPLARRYSTESIFKWSVTFISTSYYLGYLILGYSAASLYTSSRHTSGGELDHTTLISILFGLALLNALNSSSGTACGQTLVSRSPSRHYLSKLNTLSEYMANLGHGLGAIVGCNLWSVGVRYHLVRGQFVWCILVGMACLLAGLSSRITKEKSWQEEEEEDVDVV